MTSASATETLISTHLLRNKTVFSKNRQQGFYKYIQLKRKYLTICMKVTGNTHGFLKPTKCKENPDFLGEMLFGHCCHNGVCLPVCPSVCYKMRTAKKLSGLQR